MVFYLKRCTREEKKCRGAIAEIMPLHTLHGCFSPCQTNRKLLWNHFFFHSFPFARRQQRHGGTSRAPAAAAAAEKKILKLVKRDWQICASARITTTKTRQQQKRMNEKKKKITQNRTNERAKCGKNAASCKYIMFYQRV